jgi:very-short-patch-repair endonuclease
MPNKAIQIACDIWDRDSARYIEIQKEFGYEILVVWEKEWKENPDFIIEKCLHFLTNNNI